MIATPDADSRQATADRYYAEGCELVERADTYWTLANDPKRPEDMRAVARSAYERVAMQARCNFRRHDVLLDAIAQD